MYLDVSRFLKELGQWYHKSTIMRETVYIADSHTLVLASTLAPFSRSALTTSV